KLCNAKRDDKKKDQSIIEAIIGHTPDTNGAKHYDGGATVAHKLSALQLLPIPTGIRKLDH
ncbi:integrase, partial [Pseudomonas syringae pv. tagetis]